MVTTVPHFTSLKNQMYTNPTLVMPKKKNPITEFRKFNVMIKLEVL